MYCPMGTVAIKLILFTLIPCRLMRTIFATVSTTPTKRPEIAVNDIKIESFFDKGVTTCSMALENRQTASSAL